MTVKLLTKDYFEFLSLKGGCKVSSESKLVKIPHCWKSHVAVHLVWSIILTLYRTSVHPSIVIHWNTVSMARPKLSNMVIPSLGPAQPPWQINPSVASHLNPFPDVAHGWGDSLANSSAMKKKDFEIKISVSGIAYNMYKWIERYLGRKLNNHSKLFSCLQWLLSSFCWFKDFSRTSKRLSYCFQD